MGKVAFVFPGQGAQYPGMGKEFYQNFKIAKEVYEAASDTLHMDMASICFEGEEHELKKTENTQPAILTTSIAMLEVLRQEGLQCDVTAGLSLGEYASLVSSEVLDFEEAVALVQKRGKYMQEAVPEGVGTMAAILGLENEALQRCIMEASEKGVVEVANYNSPSQIVISGEIKAVQKCVELATEKGAKKAIILPVSAPFHCQLLKPAGIKLERDLMNVRVGSPRIPVVSNITGRMIEDEREIRPSLVKQVSQSVRWQESIELMLNEEVDTFIEIGPGKSLSGFIKRIAKNEKKQIHSMNVEKLEDFNQLINRVQVY